jgi:hypothetical protein
MGPNCWWGYPMVRDAGSQLLRAATWLEVWTHDLQFGGVLDLGAS